jgi:dynein heavy chain
MSELYKIHSFYKFSLDSFVIVVNRAIDLVQKADADAKAAAKKALQGDAEEEGEEGEEGEAGEKPPAEAEEEEPLQLEMTPKTLEKRVKALTESITFQGFNYTRRGTFEQHKLIISTMLTFRIL